uniref:Uncharacterized protein n=1 Tax=Romanomermis culicivorax TaxID=13658 RepID=A0A915J3Z8_ROMCU
MAPIDSRKRIDAHVRLLPMEFLCQMAPTIYYVLRVFLLKTGKISKFVSKDEEDHIEKKKRGLATVAEETLKIFEIWYYKDIKQ